MSFPHIEGRVSILAHDGLAILRELEDQLCVLVKVKVKVFMQYKPTMALQDN